MRSIRQIHSQFLKLKKILTKRMLTPVQQAHQVKIRDVIATHPGSGEFEIDGTAPVLNSKITTYATEPETKLVNRMYHQIYNLALYANKFHLHDNFDNPDEYQPPESVWTEAISTLDKEDKNDPEKILQAINNLAAMNKLAVMKNNCKNNITRLITNEFFFYPCKERGPLTQEGFGLLLEKIEQMARELPENLYLVLGTFPVSNKLNQTSNILVHVQCSLHPRIDISAKLFPFFNDPDYPHSHNVYFTGDTLREQAAVVICRISERLMTEIDRPIAEIRADLKSLLILCESELKINIANPKFFVNFLLARPVTGKMAEMIMQAAIRQYEKNFQSLYSAACKIAYEYNLAHVNKQGIRLQENSGNELQRQKNSGTEITYGAQITCFTAGNLSFRTAVDICLDFIMKTTLIALERELKQDKRTAGEIKPTHISQVISSDSTELKKEGLISKSKFATHADPEPGTRGQRQFSSQKNDFDKINNINQEDIPAPLFGLPIDLLTYAPHPVEPLEDQYAVILDADHDLTLSLTAYRMLREQYPKQRQTINMLINHLVFNNLIKQLDCFDGDKISSIAYQIKTELLDYLQTFNRDHANFRSDLINYHLEINNDSSLLPQDPDVIAMLEKISDARDLIMKDMLSDSLIAEPSVKQDNEYKDTFFKTAQQIKDDNATEKRMVVYQAHKKPGNAHR